MRSTAGTVLTPERKEIIARSVSVALREGLKEAAREPEGEERSEPSGGGRRSRIVLLAAVGTAIRYLLRRRGRSGSEAATGGRSVPVESGESTEGAGSTGRSGGRRLLSMVVRLGAIVAVAYALARRYGSSGVENAITDASERTRAIADRTASRAGKAAYKVDSISEEVADRIEERGGEAADRMEERGEETADRMEEVAETTEEMAGGSEGTAEESEGGEETEEGEEAEAEEGEGSEGGGADEEDDEE